MHFPRLTKKMFILLFGLFFYGAACSNAPEAQEPVAADEKASADAAAAPEPAADGAPAEAAATTDEAAPAADGAATAEADSAEGADSELDAGADEAAAPTDAVAAGSAPVGEQREVRYILSDGTQCYADANEASAVVAKYQVGDPVVVLIQGDWAEIAEHRFVKTSALSMKIVPRKRLDGWIATVKPTTP